MSAELQQVPAVTPDGLTGLMSSGEMPTRQLPPRAAEPVDQRVVIERKRVTSLTIVVPAKNEALNLPGLLGEINTEIERATWLEFCEILVISDGSSDETAEIAEAGGSRAIRHAHSLGNGAAVKRGIREARGDWILLLDGDGQHPPAELLAMLDLAEKHDMVVASRGGRGGSMHRNFANRIYSGFASYVSGKHIPDLTSGYPPRASRRGQGPGLAAAQHVQLPDDHHDVDAARRVCLSRSIRLRCVSARARVTSDCSLTAAASS